MSVTLHESAYAKLNLTLDVLDRRPDGYHNIRSVMQKSCRHSCVASAFFIPGRRLLSCNFRVCAS